MQIPTLAELKNIETMLIGFDDRTVDSMQHIRELQGLAPRDITDRFTSKTPANCYKYMQSSFSGVRPIHFTAAFSWITQTPATGFYLHSDIQESYRGMDQDAVAGLLSVGHMPGQQFDIAVRCIYEYLDEEGKRSINILREQLTAELGTSEFEQTHLAPDKIDIDKFAESYYKSAALTLRAFRDKYRLTQSDLAKAVGISLHSYQTIENVRRAHNFPISYAIRLKLAFKLDSHVGFTSMMEDYSEFHDFRKTQHVRDVLIVELLRHVPADHKCFVLEMIKALAKAYYKKHG